MENGIKIINRVGNGLSVRTENTGEGIRVIVEFPETRVKLSALKAGDTFRAEGVRYTVLEHFGNGRTAVIREEVLAESMSFSSGSNDWKKSRIRERLNREYLKGLEETFGEMNIVSHAVNLTSLDGLGDYGKSTDKVSLLTLDQYRRYRVFMKACPDCFWWLVTPDSTPSGLGSNDMLHVGPAGDVGCEICLGSMYARPYFVLWSSVLVSWDD